MRSSTTARLLVAGLFSVTMGIHAVRSAVVAAEAEENPQLAAKFWQGHPDVLSSTAMAAVGEAAALGSEVPSETLEQIRELAARAPLAAVPYLVAGALAQRRGDNAQAEQLLSAARQRAPRTAAARYLLADVYLREGRILAGLQELAVLTRIFPGISATLGPALAAYAQTPGAAHELRELLKTNPELESPLLSELASDAGNAALILSLAQPRRPGDDPPQWQQKLLSTLVAAGEYQRAYALWRSTSPGDEGNGPTFEFREPTNPSPFSWSFHEGPAGVAETEGSELRVLFSGNRDVTLAERIFLLDPGTHQVSLRTSGNTANATNLVWLATCLPSRSPIVELSLSRAQAGGISARFEVPRGCDAQRFELKGYSLVNPSRAEVRLNSFTITPGPRS